MSDHEEEQSDLALRDQRRPPSEHLLILFKALLAGLPFAGALASLLSDYIPSARTRRIEEFVTRTSEDLRSLAEQVREEYMRTDDFVFMFEKCLKGAAENPQKEKIDAFRAILVNSVIRDDLSEVEKEYLLSLATQLTTLHIRTLRFMHDPQSYLAATGGSADQIRGGFGQMFQVAMPGIPTAVIQSAFDELHRNGLTNTGSQIFGTTTSAQGLGLLRGRLTPLGRRFVGFVSSPT